MKTLTIILVLCILPILAVAENPNSRPSISVGIGGYGSWGEYSFRGITRDLTGRNIQFSVSSKIPVSQDITLWGGFEFGDSRSVAKANRFYYKSSTDRNSFSGGVGITVYIGKSINR